MVKKINLNSPANSNLSIDSAEVDSSMEQVMNTLSQIDWKLWEIYKTAKRFEKLFEADQITLDE